MGLCGCGCRCVLVSLVCAWARLCVMAGMFVHRHPQHIYIYIYLYIYIYIMRAIEIQPITPRRGLASARPHTHTHTNNRLQWRRPRLPRAHTEAGAGRERRQKAPAHRRRRGLLRRLRRQRYIEQILFGLRVFDLPHIVLGRFSPKIQVFSRRFSGSPANHRISDARFSYRSVDLPARLSIFAIGMFRKVETPNPNGIGFYIVHIRA